jgi:cell division protein FtsB
MIVALIIVFALSLILNFKLTGDVADLEENIVINKNQIEKLKKKLQKGEKR